MKAAYPQRQIAGMVVPPIGLGAMLLGMEGRPDEVIAIRTVHAALDAGVRLIDTAINYGSNGSELAYCEALVARALATWSGDSDSVLVVCKGGNLRTDTLSYVQDGSPANLRWSCETSLRALGVDAIGLYCLHSVDPKVPLAESIGELSRLRDEGKIRHIGISNAGRRQLAEAESIAPIAAVENRLSPWSLSAAPIVQQCEARGIAFLAYSPLGGRARAGRLAENSIFAQIAKERACSAQQVALAWSLARSPVVIPIPSARRPQTILDSIAAADLHLAPAELDRLQRELPLSSD